MKRSLIIATMIVTAWTLNSIAQDNGLQGPSNVRRLGNDQGGSGQEGPQRPKPPLLSALDVNSDKVIDADEIAGASAALKKLDKNGDGKLTPDEIMPPRPQQQGGEQGQSGQTGRGRGQGQGNSEGMGNRQGRGDEGRTGQGGEGMGQQQRGQGKEGGRRPPVPPFISAIDANGDKVVDAEEIANIQAAIKKLDKNGDGKLTMDELLPRPPQGGRGGQGNSGDRQGPPPENQ